MFRNQLPDDQVLNFMQLAATHLSSPGEVNKSYAAAVIEKLLLKKNANHQPVLTKDNIGQDVVNVLLSGLCKILGEGGRNHYALRAMFRVVQVAQTKVAAVANELGNVLGQFISEMAQDEEVNQNYAYLLFETAALSLKHVAHDSQAMQTFLGPLVPVLNTIIEQGKFDLIGYAFQIYALFVASSSENFEIFQTLTGSILQNSSNWNEDMKYLIPSQGQFLIAMICKHTQFTCQYTDQLLKVIEKCLSKEIRMETTGLEIAAALFERAPQVGQGT